GVEEAGDGSPLAPRAESVRGASGLLNATGRKLALGTVLENIQPQSSQKGELFCRGAWQLGHSSGARRSAAAASAAGTIGAASSLDGAVSGSARGIDPPTGSTSSPDDTFSARSAGFSSSLTPNRRAHSPPPFARLLSASL